MTETILTVMVGSRAHGTARPDSDTDYRSVYYELTSDLLQVPASARPRFSLAVEGHAGEGWEVEQALSMAAISHPSAVELAMWAPETSSQGAASLRLVMVALFSRAAAVESANGYVKNCLTKLLGERQPDRAAKLKGTYLRTLYVTERFVSEGVAPREVPLDGWGEPVRAALANELTVGQVLDLGRACEERMERAVEHGATYLPKTLEKEKWLAANQWLSEFRYGHFYG